MATAQELSTQLKKLYGNVVFDDPTNQAINAAVSNGTSVADFLGSAGSLSGVKTGNQQAAAQQAAAKYDPQLQDTLNSLDTEKQSANTSASNSVADINKQYAKAALNNPYAKLGQVNQLYDTTQLDNQTTSIGRVNQQLSDTLSDIARRYTTAQTSTAQQKNALQEALVSQYNSDANTAYQKYLDNAYRDSQAAEAKREFDLNYALQKQSAARFGSLFGQQASPAVDVSPSAPKLTKDQAIAQLKEDFAAGNLSNDQDFINGLVATTSLSLPEAQALYYDTRKPYEKPSGPTVTVLKTPKAPVTLSGILQPTAAVKSTVKQVK